MGQSSSHLTFWLSLETSQPTGKILLSLGIGGLWNSAFLGLRTRNGGYFLKECFPLPLLPSIPSPFLAVKKIPNQSNIRRKGWISAPSCECGPAWQKRSSCGSRGEKQLPYVSVDRKQTEMDAGTQPHPPFLLFVQLRTPGRKTILTKFRVYVYLPSSVQLSWKWPPRHSQRDGSWVILSLVTLTVKINYLQSLPFSLLSL